jgi:hypothetical protein
MHNIWDVETWLAPHGMGAEEVGGQGGQGSNQAPLTTFGDGSGGRRRGAPV